MIQIQKIELFHVVTPFQNKIYPSFFRGVSFSNFQTTVLKLTTNNGLVGWSAIHCSQKEFQALGPWLSESFLGKNALNMDRVKQKLMELMYRGWRNFWVEAAFWDLLGKQEEKPIYRFGELHQNQVDEAFVYASPLSLMGETELLHYLEDVQKKGFQAMKIRLTGEMAFDSDLVHKVREKAGKGFKLILDADQGRRIWKDGHEPYRWKMVEALDFLACMKDLNIEWLEEPTDMYAYDDYSVLTSESLVPIAGGQFHNGWHEFKILFEKNSLDIYQPDALVAGGISTVFQVMDACDRRKLQFTPNVSPHGLSMAANLQTFAAWNRQYLFDFPYEPQAFDTATRDGLLKKPFDVSSNGTIAVSQAPGLGVEINEKYLKNHGTLLYSDEV